MKLKGLASLLLLSSACSGADSNQPMSQQSIHPTNYWALTPRQLQGVLYDSNSPTRFVSVLADSWVQVSNASPATKVQVHYGNKNKVLPLYKVQPEINISIYPLPSDLSSNFVVCMVNPGDTNATHTTNSLKHPDIKYQKGKR